MRPSCHHTSLLRRLRSGAMRPPSASFGGKMPRLKSTTYFLSIPKRLQRMVILYGIQWTLKRGNRAADGKALKQPMKVGPDKANVDLVPW